MTRRVVSSEIPISERTLPTLDEADSQVTGADSVRRRAHAASGPSLDEP